MKKRLKSILTASCTCVLAIIILFSCGTNSVESLDSSLDSIPKNQSKINNAMTFHIYKIPKSYLNTLSVNGKVFIFQSAFNKNEHKVNIYYKSQGNYVKIPDDILIKGDSVPIAFPFSSGNNQIDKQAIQNPNYDTLHIIPIVVGGVLMFDLDSLKALSPKVAAFGRTNPSPPATSIDN